MGDTVEAWYSEYEDKPFEEEDYIAPAIIPYTEDDEFVEDMLDELEW